MKPHTLRVIEGTFASICPHPPTVTLVYARLQLPRRLPISGSIGAPCGVGTLLYMPFLYETGKAKYNLVLCVGREDATGTGAEI